MCPQNANLSGGGGSVSSSPCMLDGSGLEGGVRARSGRDRRSERCIEREAALSSSAEREGEGRGSKENKPKKRRSRRQAARGANRSRSQKEEEEHAR